MRCETSCWIFFLQPGAKTGRSYQPWKQKELCMLFVEGRLPWRYFRSIPLSWFVSHCKARLFPQIAICYFRNYPYFFHVQILMLWYAIAILACALRSNGEDCNKQTTRDSCLTTKETRSLVVHGSQIKDSICVWCDKGCTTYNNNKCEPKAFMDALERAEPGKTKGYETCLVGNK